MPSGRIFSAAIALDFRSTQNPFDPSAQPRCSFGAGKPDRLEDLEHMLGGDPVDRLVPNRGTIGRESIAPLRPMFFVSEASFNLVEQIERDFPKVDVFGPLPNGRHHLVATFAGFRKRKLTAIGSVGSDRPLALFAVNRDFKNEALRAGVRIGRDFRRLRSFREVWSLGPLSVSLSIAIFHPWAHFGPILLL
jgi:hypothetical protein